MPSATLSGGFIFVIEDEPLIAFAIQQEDQAPRTPASRVLQEKACAGFVDFSVSDVKRAEICVILQKAHIHLIVHSRYATCRDVHVGAEVLPALGQYGASGAASRGTLPPCSLAQAAAAW
jgi:hypothetical protein